MFAFLKNAAFWASLASLLAAIGIPIPHSAKEDIVALIAGICGIVGIIEALWSAGHRVIYQRPNDVQSPSKIAPAPPPKAE